MLNVQVVFAVCAVLLGVVKCGPGEYDKEHKWISLKAFDPMPVNSIYGGFEPDGSISYVARGQVAGNIIAAKSIPRKGYAYAPNYMKEHQLSVFDVLVGDGYYWVANFNGLVPKNAVSTGTNSMGERMYIGRVNYKNGLIMGKVHPSEKNLYFTYEGKEHNSKQYEILCRL